MSTWALWLTLIFVMVTLSLSLWQRLKLEKEILIGTVRSAIQLLAIGYVLQFVFAQEGIIYITILISVMILVASGNAAKRGKGLRGIFWRILLSITLTEMATLSLLLGLRIIDSTPQYVIPISGMIIGNSMVVSGLFLNNMKKDVEKSLGEIEILLSLGASARQAIHDVLQRSVKSSMIPTLDTMKTVGLVQLPGMMTGLIIAGTSPLEAVKYQILVMFSFSSAAALTSIVLGWLTYPMWFSKDLRMIL